MRAVEGPGPNQHTHGSRGEDRVGQPDVVNVEDDSVWLPLLSMASTSQEYSVSGRRNPGGTRSLVAVGGIITSKVTTGRALRLVSRSTNTWYPMIRLFFGAWT